MNATAVETRPPLRSEPPADDERRRSRVLSGALVEKELCALKPRQPLDTAPPAVRATAATYGLGASFQQYQPHNARVRRGVRIVALFVAVLLFHLGVYVVPLLVVHRAPPPELAVFLGFSALALAVGGARAIIELNTAVKTARCAVYLFEPGLVLTDRNGRARAFLWSEIAVARYEFQDTDSSHTRVTMSRPDGAVLVLDDHTYWNSTDV